MDEYDCTPPSRRLRLIDLAVVGCTLLRDVTADVAQAFDLLADVVIGHANHKIDIERFQREAALEIEALTEGD